mmetsp:Transcript_116896/g.327053  ORF Transcript_116896/g.327053 Transcript_116896/m.327053 type:complete len:447 (+) Transcript_116896:76-1416(+)
MYATGYEMIDMLKQRRVVRHSSTLGSSGSGKGMGKEPLLPKTERQDSVRPANPNCTACKAILLSKLNVLLVCAPLGFVSGMLGWSDSSTFWLNFFALIPLANILGDATEELAACLKNDMLSGLLNATFGNAVEMIMSIALLKNNEYEVIKSTLLGSILSNMLLVLGMSFLVGGLVKSRRGGSSITNADENGKQQKFGILGALVSTSLLLVSCLCLCLVTIFSQLRSVSDADQEVGGIPAKMKVSRACAVLISSAYVAYIVFQMVTHRQAMADEEEEDEEEEEEHVGLSLGWSLGLLFAVTCVVAVGSEFLTNSLEGALQSSGIGKEFVGIILLPIVGNACEHAAAIRFAAVDKVGLAVGIAVGSSVQIALFVTPFTVLMGWALGNDAEGHNMDLNFGGLNVSVMTLSVFILLSIVVDGKANWLEGYMLCIAYAIVGVLYWYMPDEE